jgi:fructokinase
MQDLLLGIDVGGTKTELCLVQLDPGADPLHHCLIGSLRMATDAPSGLESYLLRLSASFGRLLSESRVEKSRIRALGIGLPGAFNPVSAEISRGSIPFLTGIPLEPLFRDALRFEGVIALENDANCFTLAEARLGAGADWAQKSDIPPGELCLLGITLGTGVGGGILTHGRLIKGRRGGAGEIGHSTLHPEGRPCYCGKRGCAEQDLSGGGFEASFHARTSSRERLSSREIFKRIEEGNPFAIATFESYREDLITFLSNLSNILDPHVIVLGGGMSAQDRLYPGLEERLSEACFLTENPPSILKHRIGDSAGVIGAAVLGHEAFETIEQGGVE